MAAEKADTSKEGDKSRLQATEKEEAKEPGFLMKCTSCGVKIEAEDRWVKFSCPRCNKQKIIRCNKCKKLMNSYECKKCGFVGP